MRINELNKIKIKNNGYVIEMKFFKVKKCLSKCVWWNANDLPESADVSDHGSIEFVRRVVSYPSPLNRNDRHPSSLCLCNFLDDHDPIYKGKYRN
jgi:hypothetical protein